MKPIQVSFLNTNHFNSLILQTQGNDSGVQMYQSIMNKLFKFLKKKLPVDVYNEIKYYFKNEVIKIHAMISNDSISSIFDLQSTSSRSDMKNGKKLKLSYDLCHSKAKSIKIDMSHLKKEGKELHSLYSIIKGNHQMITKNLKSSKTQSNSKSKSRSISRECSSNHTHHQIFSSKKKKKVVKVKYSLINKSHPLLNGKLFSKINKRVHTQIKYPFAKISNTQSIVLKKSFPMNNNWFNIYNIKYQPTIHPKSITPAINYNNHPSEPHKSKNCSTTLVFQNKPISSISQSPTMHAQTQFNNDQILNTDTKNNGLLTEHESYCNNTQRNRNQNNQIIEKKLIESTSNCTRPGNIRNEELMKTIKSTLDDNLKVMFNFSYENFLSKESESESKTNSFQELNSNDQNDVHYYTTTNRKR